MRGPLERIKVIDCGQWIQAPMAAALLGDLGADVIKIEDREKGDPLRGVLQANPEVERPTHFEVSNRNKRGITLDLNKQQGKEILYKLTQKSDVFIHNFRPRAVKRLGLNYETLSHLNPGLIYAQASGWGTKGSESEKGAAAVFFAIRKWVWKRQ